MLTYFLYFLICLFALYGGIILVSDILDVLWGHLRHKKRGIRLILAVRDCEDSVEGIIRELFAGGVPQEAMTNGRLMVLDMGSADSTREILKKLGNDIEQLEYLEIENKDEFFTRLKHSLAE